MALIAYTISFHSFTIENGPNQMILKKVCGLLHKL